MSVTLAPCLAATSVPAGTQWPELVLQSGHNLGVAQILFNTNGKFVATVGLDNEILVWDAYVGTVLHRLHSSVPVTSIAFSGDASILAEIDNAGTLSIWNVGEESRTQFGPELAWGQSPLIFSSDYSTMLFCDAKGDIAVWNFAEKRIVRTLEGDTKGWLSFALSPGDKLLAASDPNGSIILWDYLSGKRTGILPGDKSAIVSLAFSQDGSLVASGGGTINKGELVIWDVVERRLIHRTESANLITSVAFLSNNELLAFNTYEEGGTAEVLNTATWDVVRRISAPVPISGCIGLNLDRGLIAFGQMVTGTVFLVDATNRGAVLRLPPKPEDQGSALGLGKPFLMDTPVFSVTTGVAFTPDMNWLVTGFDSDFGVWDLKTGAMVERIGASQKASLITTIKASANSRTIVVGRTDGSIQFWDLYAHTTQRELSMVKAVSDIALDSYTRRVAAVDDAGQVKIWAPAQTRPLASWRSDTPPFSALVFKPGGDEIALERKDGSLEIRRVNRPALLHSIKQRNCGPFNTPSVTWSADGSIIAATCGSSIFLWNATTLTQLGTLSGRAEGVTFVMFDASGKKLLTTATDGTAVLWDVKNRTPLESFGNQGHYIRSGALSPDATWVATATSFGAAYIWDAKNNTPSSTLLALYDSNDWLAVSQAGWFDGTEDAWKTAMWRYGEKPTEIVPLELFFEQYYTPGLLSNMIARRLTSRAAKLDFSRLYQPSLGLTLEPVGVNSDTPEPIRRTLEQLQASNTMVTERVRTIDIQIDSSSDPDAGVKGVRLFRNGILIKTWKENITLDRTGHANLSLPVTIEAGENHFRAYAYTDSSIKSEDASLVVTGSKDLGRLGQVYLLVIGINNYSNRNLQLRYAVPDAEEVVSEVGIVSRWKEFSKVNILSLLNGEARKQGILAALKTLAGNINPVPTDHPSSVERFEQIGPEDILFIYFAGHGFSDNNHFYFILPSYNPQVDLINGGSTDLDEIRRNSISDTELSEALEPLDARRIVLIVDACESGQALGERAETTGPMNSFTFGHLAFDKGMYVLTASQATQTAGEVSALGHGLLTYALVNEGLKGAGTRIATEKISLRDWLAFAASEVPRLDSENRIQRALIPKSRTSATQTPRLFYRREEDSSPIFIYK
jgi:WD40 repeat protein/uncharacterized caspase-like protein